MPATVPQADQPTVVTVDQEAQVVQVEPVVQVEEAITVTKRLLELQIAIPQAVTGQE
jgi:hypothetical protein